MILGGAVMLAVGLRPGAAEIYGKVATFAFYGVMLAIIAFGPGFGAFVQLGASPMPDWMIMILVVVSAILTLVASLAICLRPSANSATGRSHSRTAPQNKTVCLCGMDASIPHSGIPPLRPAEATS